MTQNRTSILAAVIAILISVGLVAAVVQATTTVGNNVSVGGTLSVTGTTTLATTTISDLTVTGTSTLATTTVPLLENPSANLYFQSTSNYIDSGGNLVVAGKASSTEVNTGQGPTEVYSMDQAVDSSSNVSFNNLNLSGTSSLATTTIGGGTAIAKHMSTTTSHNFGTTSPNSCTSTTVSVSGAASSDVVAVGVPSELGNLSGMSWTGWVSSGGTVTIRGCNATAASTSNPTSAVIRADVWQH